MLPPVTLAPIGIVRNAMHQIIDDVFGGVVSRIELDPQRFTAESLAGLADFSHAEIVFHFHQLPESVIVTGARHPRNRKDWPAVGIFAQRGKARPNRIGVTICRIVSVQGMALAVEGLDALDGTPVLDIKPYMKEFAPRGPVHQPAWATELMAHYWDTK